MGVVEPDPEDTIDGAEPPARVDAPVDAPVDATGDDYPELVPVERRHYVISGEIAKGGMGRVLAARDLRLGRAVAIKQLLPKNRDAARRFEREARITARLQHPAIIHVYEAGVWPGGEPFYTMTMVEGRSLDKVVAERATLNERLGLLPNVIAVVDALAYAHSEHVIHRDLKPANVLVGEFGETVVIDWGLAKDLHAPIDPAADPATSRPLRVVTDETVSGSVVGTPAYMPPEQARGESVDQRADVYALGALLYKVLAGVAPYVGASADVVLELVRTRAPVSVDVHEPGTPPDLAAIVAKAMARAPADRYPTAGALAQDLKRFETGQLVAAHRYTRSQLAWRWIQRHRFAVAITTIASITLALVATVTVRGIVFERDRAEAEEHRASLGRVALLEERGRSELLAGHAGAALAYLVGAAHDGGVGGARGFLLADAMAPFEAERRRLVAGASALAVAVSPDGAHVVTSSAGLVQVWKVDGTLERQLDDGVGRAPVGVLAFDPTSTRLAAASDDGVVRVWTIDGALVATLAGHRGAILDLQFDHDGRTLVSAGSDATARVWTLATGSSVVSSCDTGPVVSARFDGSGTRVVTASGDGACVWSAQTGKTSTLIRGHAEAVNHAAWSPDGTWIVTASDDGSARIWSARYGKLVVAVMRHDRGTVTVAEVSADGRFVLTAGSDHVARLWALPSLPIAPMVDGSPTLTADTLTSKIAELPAARVSTTFTGHTDTIVAATFGGDDDRLVATASADRVARVWDRATGQVVASYEHGDLVASVAFAATDDLVTASHDGSVRIWDPRLLEVRHRLDSAIHAIALAADGTVAVGTDDSHVTLFHGETTRVLREHLGRVHAVAFTPDGASLVTAGDDPHPIVWNVASGQPRGRLGAHATAVRAVAISPDGRTVATGATDGVQLATLAGAPIRMLDQRGATMPAVAFDPSGAFVLGGADDGALVVWDLQGGVHDLRGGMVGAVTALAFSPVDHALVVAGRKHVRIYPYAAGRMGARPTVTLEGPTGEVRAVVVSRDGALVITGSDDGIARVWDAAKGKLLGTRDPRGGAIGALALDGDLLWIGTADGTLGAWDVHSERRPVDALEGFLVDKHVPEHLDRDDVVRRITDGNPGRGPDGR